MSSLVQRLTRLLFQSKLFFRHFLSFSFLSSRPSILVHLKPSLTMSEVYQARQSHTPPPAPRKALPVSIPPKHESRPIRVSSLSNIARILPSDPFTVGDTSVHSYMNSSTQETPESLPQPPSTAAATGSGASSETATLLRLSWWKNMFTSTHPLLWVSLALSFIALFSGVPKHSAPILISRTNLRVRPFRRRSNTADASRPRRECFETR